MSRFRIECYACLYARNWLRPDAPTSDDRLFCHVYGRGDRKTGQFVPGWPYSFVAALECDRTSWGALLDAVRLGPANDATFVTTLNCMTSSSG